MSFVGANNGFVTIVYDQVGTNNVTQSTSNNQLRVVESGSLVTLNNRLLMRNYSTSPVRELAFGSNVSLTDMTFFAVAATEALTTNTTFFTISPGFSDALFAGWTATGNPTFRKNNNNVSNPIDLSAFNVLKSFSFRHNNTTLNVDIAVDNQLLISSSLASDTFTGNVIYRSANLCKQGDILIFNTRISDLDRYNVNKNIDDFYGI